MKEHFCPAEQSTITYQGKCNWCGESEGSMTQEALKLALEALEYWDVHGKLHQPTEEAITAIKEALAQTQEPVAWRAPRWSNLQGEYGYRDFNDPVIDISTGKPSLHNEPLYTTPPQRTWVGLTDEDRLRLWLKTESEDVDRYDFAKAVEAALKELNT